MRPTFSILLAALAALLGACGGDAGTGANSSLQPRLLATAGTGPNFTVRAKSIPGSVPPLGTGYVTVVVTPSGGFSGAVTGEADGGLAHWITVRPFTVDVSTGAVATYTVGYTLSADIPTGTHSLSLKLRSGGIERSVTHLVEAAPVGLTYDYPMLPGSQTISGGLNNTWQVPNAEIHQTAWTSKTGAPNLAGNYAYPVNGWDSLQWRWADTTRVDSITRVMSPGPVSRPAYRFEVSQADGASEGTQGNAPRAELFSVDAEEDKRRKEPPRSNIVKEGDEYWATWGMYLNSDFPLNHWWADLFQRKWDNTHVPTKSWFEISAHGDSLDYCIPGGVYNNCNYKRLMTITQARGRWIQFTIHEKASVDPSKGLFELYMNGVLVERFNGATIESTSTNYNFHYGYYRTNDARVPGNSVPGTGVVYMSPFMIRRGAVAGDPQVPAIP
ncbi:MAG TPA: heparin lyase I family protein [Burkholderiaceae bacterium]